MSNTHLPDRALPSRNRGVYTLVAIMILLGASLLLVRSLMVTSTQEIRSTANERAGRELFHTAEAALDYGIAWYTANEPDWPSTPGTQTIGITAGDEMGQVTAASGDLYDVGVNYSRITGNEGFILVTATATLATDAALTATVQQYIHSNVILRDRSFVGPPLLLNGCFGHITGTASIHVHDDPEDPERVAVLSSHPAVGLPGHDPACLDQGHLDYCLESNCLPGAIPETSAESYGLTSDPDELWYDVFELPREDMKAIADRELANGVADEDRSVIWVSDSSPYHESWGSPEQPVAVIFAPEADCPKLNGSPVYYGVVFVDSPCTSGQGWGGAEVYGTVVINGDLSKFSANTEIYDWGLAGGTTAELPKADYTARVPGTWHDF